MSIRVRLESLTYAGSSLTARCKVGTPTRGVMPKVTVVFPAAGPRPRFAIGRISRM